MPNPYDLTHDEMAALLAGEPQFRVRQLMTGLYQQDLFPEEITTLSAPLRQRLATELPLSLTVAHDVETDEGETRKWVLSLIHI